MDCKRLTCYDFLSHIIEGLYSKNIFWWLLCWHYIVRSADFNYRPNDFDGSVVIEAAVQTLQTKAIKLRLLDSLGHDFKVDDCKQ